MVIDPVYLLRAVDELPVKLAYTDPLQGHKRAPQETAKFGKNQADPVPGSHGNHHHRDLGVAAEERGPLAPAVGSPVDSE